MLKLPTSLGFLLGTQPAVAGTGSLVELEIRIYWVEEGYKMQNKTCKLPTRWGCFQLIFLNDLDHILSKVPGEVELVK